MQNLPAVLPEGFDCDVGQGDVPPTLGVFKTTPLAFVLGLSLRPGASQRRGQKSQWVEAGSSASPHPEVGRTTRSTRGRFCVKSSWLAGGDASPVAVVTKDDAVADHDEEDVLHREAMTGSVSVPSRAAAPRFPVQGGYRPTGCRGGAVSLTASEDQFWPPQRHSRM